MQAERVVDAPAVQPRGATGTKALYFSLLRNDTAADGDGDSRRREMARRFLEHCFDETAGGDDLPASVDALPQWMAAATAVVTARYRDYLEQRRCGAPRRYFRNRSHALFFLRAVAPTKLVDGAWLYGLLPFWRDQRLRPLIRIYLEELGEGDSDRNHVAIYRRLLARHGCDDWEALDEEHFAQGAVQLALAWSGVDHIPEIIGFNLGYEQLPLHLLITTYELAELGIDPAYFRLHITIDNGASGHARQALRSVVSALPLLADPQGFYRRLRRGYRLNRCGLGSEAIITGFDADAALLDVLARKGTVGHLMHSDRCRLGGLTVNQWVDDPARIAGFLQALQRHGWIRRGQPPAQSRFWQLVQGGQAPMAGVFTDCERQLIRDWIAGDAAGIDAGVGGIQAAVAEAPDGDAAGPDFNGDSRALAQALAALPDRAAKLDYLVPLLSPSHHATVPGLMATRLFNRLLG